jgi:hypothetical protein
MNFIKLSALTLLLGWSSFSSAILIDFDDYTISGFANQDNSNGVATIMDSGATLNLVGNTWKSVLNINTVVTSSTVLYFDYMSTLEGENQSLGFEDDNVITPSTLFQLFGTDNSGAYQDFNDYQISDGWKAYSIDVGNFFTGSFNRLLFVNDHDKSPKNATSFFRNIEICDGCRAIPVSAPEPSGVMLLALGMFILVARRFKR